MNETVDLDDDTLPGDDAPPEADTYGSPAKVPPDQGNADAELKEQSE